MKIVVDTNVLFSFFRKDSTTRKIISDTKLFEFYSPDFALEELKKNKESICLKAKITHQEFEETIKDMEFLYVKAIPLKDYLDNLATAKEVCPHPKDIDFFALALKLGCPIWSIESRLKNQTAVKVINTKELLFLLESIAP